MGDRVGWLEENWVTHFSNRCFYLIILFLALGLLTPSVSAQSGNIELVKSEVDFDSACSYYRLNFSGNKGEFVSEFATLKTSSINERYGEFESLDVQWKVDGEWESIIDTHISNGKVGVNAWKGITTSEIAKRYDELSKDGYIELRICGEFQREEVDGDYVASLDHIPSFMEEEYSEYAWWNSTWGKKAALNIDNTGNSERSYTTVNLNLSYVSTMNNDFSDVRFVNDSSLNSQPYYLINKSNGNYANFKINITHLPAGAWDNSTYYVYWENPDAVSQSVSYDTIMPHYEDFSDGTLSPYSSVGDGSVSVEGSAAYEDSYGVNVTSYSSDSVITGLRSDNFSLTSSGDLTFYSKSISPSYDSATRYRSCNSSGCSLWQYIEGNNVVGDFESDLEGWSLNDVSGSGIARGTEWSLNGSYGVGVYDTGGVDSGWVNKSIDLSDYETLTVPYRLYGYGSDGGGSHAYAEVYVDGSQKASDDVHGYYSSDGATSYFSIDVSGYSGSHSISIWLKINVTVNGDEARAWVDYIKLNHSNWVKEELNVEGSDIQFRFNSTENATTYLDSFEAENTPVPTAYRGSVVDDKPPDSITDLTKPYIYYCNCNIEWTWSNPPDPDFSHTMVYVDGDFKTNTSNEYYVYGSPGNDDHTISTKTVDTSGNVNDTWVNHSVNDCTVANITARDEFDNTSISSITVEYNNGGDSKSGSSVLLNRSDLDNPDSTNSITISATDYEDRNLLIDPNTCYQDLTAYLVSTTNASQITIKVLSGEEEISNAKVIVEKEIGGTYHLMSSGYTDDVGSFVTPLIAHDTYKISASKSGIGSVTENRTIDSTLINIYINEPTNQTGAGIQYPPHQVRIAVKDMLGRGISGVNVTAYGVETTMGSWSWLGEILGIDWGTTRIHNTTMTGTTGTDGSVSFMMFESIRYKIHYYKPSAGINETDYLYPKEDYYTHIVGPNIFNKTTSLHSKVSWNLTTENINTTHYSLNLTYNDTLNKTTYLEFYVLNETKNKTYNITFTGQSNISTGKAVLGNGTYYWGFNATHSQFGKFSEMKPVEFYGSNIKISLGFEDNMSLSKAMEYYTWISITLIIVVAGMFSIRTVDFGAVMCPFIAGFFWWVGWLPINEGVMVSAMLIGALVYIGRGGGT